MSLMGWTRFFRSKRPPAVEAQISRQLAIRIAERADAIQKSLKVYQHSRDPFAALMADLYTRDQLTRTYLNGKG